MASIARTSVVLSGIGLVGSLVSFVAQRALANAFGVGIDLDTFFVASSLPALIGGLLTGVMVYQVVPMLKYCEDGTQNDVQDALVQLWFYAGAIIAPSGMLISWVILRYYPNGESYCTHHAQWVAAAAWIGVWNGLLTAVLTAICHVQGLFIRAACVGYAPSILSIGACLWIAAKGGSTILVALAILLGQCAGTVMLAVQLRQSVSFSFRFHPAMPVALRGMSQLPLVLLSMFVFNCFGAFDAYWAARLDEGAISTLAYAQRLIVALAGVAVNGTAVVMLPRFADSAAREDREGLLQDARRAIRAILLVMAPIAVTVAVIAKPTVAALFEGGRFGTTETEQLAGVLPLMLAGMVLMSCCNVLFRVHFAMRDIRGAAGLGIAGAAGYFFLSGLLLPIGEIRGLGAAYMLCWLGVFALSIWRIWGRRDVMVLVPGARRWLGCVAPPLFIAGLTAWGIQEMFEDWGIRIGLGRIVGVYLFVGFVFGNAGILTGVPELRALLHRLGIKLPKWATIQMGESGNR